jgi:diguanylate cyclase (GGDEF)-like protein
MTAMKFDTGQLKALEAGGDDYLVKPIAPRLLLRSVRTRSERAFLLRSLSDQDGLTRILNRASMMRQFDGLLSRAKRYSEKMAVAMVDIDHFKSMNDTHGHQAGDAILRDLAQFLRKNIRQSDVVGRYGGEEFTLFSPQTDAQTAVATLDKLRVEFGKRNQSLPGGGFASVTFSGGVAEFPRSGEDRVSLIAAADSALYTSKEEGRNRISLAPS